MFIRVTSTEFQQNVGRYQDAAQHAPVAITKNGRAHTVLMSAALFERVMKGRVARLIEDLDDDTVRAIADSSVAAEYVALDDIIKDWIREPADAWEASQLNVTLARGP